MSFWQRVSRFAPVGLHGGARSFCLVHLSVSTCVVVSVAGCLSASFVSGGILLRSADIANKSWSWKSALFSSEVWASSFIESCTANWHRWLFGTGSVRGSPAAFAATAGRGPPSAEPVARSRLPPSLPILLPVCHPLFSCCSALRTGEPLACTSCRNRGCMLCISRLVFHGLC